MKNFLNPMFKSIGTKFNQNLIKLFHKYGENPGSMLVHTGVVGWILSSFGQISAIVLNDKLSKEQKLFLIPQEASDAFTNIISFYTLTNGVKFLGSKLTKSCKLRTAAITKLLEERGLILKKGAERALGKKYAGDWDFDITKLPDYNPINSDNLLRKTFKPFNNGVEVAAGLVGSIISGNLVTPVVRNIYASKRQKHLMAKVAEMQNSKIPITKQPTKQLTMQSFLNNAQLNSPYRNSGMKI